MFCETALSEKKPRMSTTKYLFITILSSLRTTIAKNRTSKAEQLFYGATFAVVNQKSAMRIVLILFALTITLSACKSNEKVQRDLSKVQILVGSGGGFTGFYTEYKIFGTGKVERYTSKDEKTAAIGNVQPDSIRVWVNELDRINFYGIELNQPGNMSYYMELTEPEKINRVKWGSATPPAAVQSIYDRILRAVEK